MTTHWKYLVYLCRHKWFVFVAGRRTGAPLWRLLIHDWSKFTPDEWTGYVRHFYGGEKTDAIRSAFDRAWLHHQHWNPHHWQHWVLREDSGETKVLEMPEHFAREMVADWAGAGRAIIGRWEVREWFAKNHQHMLLHENTKLLVQHLLVSVVWPGEEL